MLASLIYIYSVCVCVCVCVCVSVIISLCRWVIFVYVDAVYWFYRCSFSMLNWLFHHDCLDTNCFWVSYKHAFSIFVFAPVQHNWACFTWKSALEICSLLLLLLLISLRSVTCLSPSEHDPGACPWWQPRGSCEPGWKCETAVTNPHKSRK